MAKDKSPVDIFYLVSKQEMDIEEFMTWYHSIRTKAYSEGYKEASDNAYRGGSEF